ncbi:DNA protecting protein DprA [Enterovibrio norvegicus FF-33]|uniref:DNA protecting protein DprA n=1 Tax=Enterovibrio norvegicus FF-454 TaxID=1185651 RepID=A0A1E5C284_9GAMM|nr:DNA-processing protein DprA [Enterovibrio norvegicus]OEE59581.1 DNA protecting protein DprA [Enterovibrio norvegicus FF-454]OEE69255.1 DNA protecting protein DprA [Enterovibrio norvegicus FF-33]
MDASLESWLRLAAVPRLGGNAVSKIICKYPPEKLVELEDIHLAALGFKPAQIKALRYPDMSVIDKCMTWCSLPNRDIISLTDPRYPYLLKQISGAPPLLFVEGNPDVLSLPQIAIVGSRDASAEGLSLAHAFAQSLAEHDVVVTSGLALGIDGRAHRGALDAGGRTIAVLGSGLEKVYPSPHRDLAKDVTSNGALVSELWPWSPPKPAFFPRRNRIISGLSTGVLVVEAALKSGSLITARLALEQGRDVFALPGSIHNPHAKGSNGLIKQGAFLVESVDEILEQVGALAGCAINHQLDVAQAQVLQEELPFPELLANVGNEARCVDVLAEICDQPVHEIMMKLLELELLGLVSAVPGGYVRARRG